MTEKQHSAILPGETQDQALARLASFSNAARAGDGYDEPESTYRDERPTFEEGVVQIITILLSIAAAFIASVVIVGYLIVCAIGDAARYFFS